MLEGVFAVKKCNELPLNTTREGLMAGRRDSDGDGYSPAVAARRAQVDRLRPPPVDGII
jgi:hypothetical protein